MMEKEQIIRILGAFVAIVMVVSMFAMALLYGGGDDSSVNTQLDQSLQPTVFAYTVTFDSIVMEELSAMKFNAYTTELDIQDIDRDILAIEGVRKVNSSFQATGGNNWIYASEVTTKKGYSIEDIATQISDLEYFDSEIQASKYIIVKTPSEPVLLTNETLGIDKNYTFEIGTVSAVSLIETQIGDEVAVSGSISIQNNLIQTLELYELINYTQLGTEVIDANMSILDENISEVVVDENLFEDSNN